MIVAICNLHVEYGHFTLKQTYKNVLNNIFKVNNGLWVFLGHPCILPSELWRILACVMARTLTVTLGWINAWMYSNCCYSCFFSPPMNRNLYVLFKQWEWNPIITYKSVAWLPHFQEGIVYESWGLPHSCKWLQTFQKNLLPSFSTYILTFWHRSITFTLYVKCE
jgi:hypothetical protein